MNDLKQTTPCRQGFLSRVPSPVTLPLVLMVLHLVGPMAYGQQASPAPGDDSLTAQEERAVREAGKKIPPAELEDVIKAMNADRHKIWNYKNHPEQVRQELMTSIDQMRKANSRQTSAQFGKARDSLDSRLHWFSHNKVAIPPELGSELAEALIDIYAQRAAYTSAPDHLPIMLAAKYGNSSRVKEYLIKILQGPRGPERERALDSLAATASLKGDPQIYATLLGELRRTEQDNDAGVLGVLSMIDKQKALPLLLREVDTTKKIGRFTEVSDYLSRYGRPELMEHVFRRIDEFPRKSWGDSENPMLGVDDGLLLRYIRENEDEKLELGLRALELAVGALIKSQPVLLEKLDKGTPRSRRAVGVFLQQTSGVAVFAKPTVIQALQDHMSKESDAKAKQALGVAIDRIRKNETGKGNE